MVEDRESVLLSALKTWLDSEPLVLAAILFGSMARPIGAVASADEYSDVDLHLVVTEPKDIETADWQNVLPSLHLIFKVVRPASGGVRKLTLIFEEGEADLVIVPATWIRITKWLMAVGIARRVPFINDSLNKLATILSGGYVFLKGAVVWGRFYERISRLPGVRIGDDEAQMLADIFLYDLTWVAQKIERGELIAAQRILHRNLAETNIILLHELRLRNNGQTFQQARRIEQIASPAQIDMVRIDSNLDTKSLINGARIALVGLHALMNELVPRWRPSDGAQKLLAMRTPAFALNFTKETLELSLRRK